MVSGVLFSNRKLYFNIVVIKASQLINLEMDDLRLHTFLDVNVEVCTKGALPDPRNYCKKTYQFKVNVKLDSMTRQYRKYQTCHYSEYYCVVCSCQSVTVLPTTMSGRRECCLYSLNYLLCKLFPYALKALWLV
jgi:hypothetical protein